MGYKALAIIDGDDGRTYRIRKWNAAHRTAVGEISRPGQLQVRDPDGGWEELSRWSVAKSEFEVENQSDGPVLEEGLNRLDVAFGVEPEEIVYDDCSHPARVDPDGVAVESL